MLLAVHHRVMEHVGSLESTQEAIASGNSYASFVLSKLPTWSITWKGTLKHEPVIYYRVMHADIEFKLKITVKLNVNSKEIFYLLL